MSDYSARWLLIAGCAVVGAFTLATIGVGFDAWSVWSALQNVLLCLFLAAILRRLGRTAHVPLHRPVTAALDFSLSLAQFSIVIMVVAPFSYLAAMSGFPLLDSELARFDAMLGFEWDNAARWVAERPALDRILQYAYLSLPYQSVAALLIGSVLRPGERNRELIWLTILGLSVCIAISAFTPALGKVGHVGPGYLAVIDSLRNGGWSVLDYNAFEGIVTFPSFHMAAAVFLIYVARHSRLALSVSAPLNLAMMAATPTAGGHYLIDVLAGGAVAIACILLVRRMERWNASAASPARRPAFAAEGLSPG